MGPFHVTELTEGHIRSGLAPEIARRKALMEAGGMEQLKERVRVASVGFTFETWLKDVSYALKGFRRTPGFVLAVVLMLALVIGANTALFGLIDAAFLRKLPVRDADQIVFFNWRSQDWNPGGYLRGTMIWTQTFRTSPSFSYRVFEVFRESARTLSDVIAFSRIDGAYARFDSGAKYVTTQFVSGNFYRSLGVGTALGRTLTEADDDSIAEPAAVISHRYWKRQFGLDPGVIGTKLFFAPGTQPVIIVGVAAEECQGLGGFGNNPDLTFPLSVRIEPQAVPQLKDAAVWSLYLMGRMKPGVTFEQVRGNIEGPFQGVALEAAENPGSGDLPRLEVLSGSGGDPTGFNFGSRGNPEEVIATKTVLVFILILLPLVITGVIKYHPALTKHENISSLAILHPRLIGLRTGSSSTQPTRAPSTTTPT